MEITEVRIKLMEESDDRLQGFCSVTFDNCFVVRDLKIIDGTSGPFVAMPSRKLTSHCHSCGSKNHLKAAYCNHCGAKQREDRAVRDAEGRAKLYADIAHPINSTCREMIQSRVIAEYRTERERAMQPGYVSRYEDDYDDDVDTASLLPQDEPRERGAPMPSGMQAQPAQLQPPAPHMLPAPVAPQGPGPISTGGPHFLQPPPAREEVKEDKQAGGRSKPERGDFRSGVF